MIKLNLRNREACSYDPPIPIDQLFGDIDTTLPEHEQVRRLCWIPAVLVARFRYQFPHLRPESDELFSIGVTKVVEIVARHKYSGDKIGAVCNVQCRRAMEDYANGLQSVVKVCTTTRYENRKRGVATPTSGSITGNETMVASEDDHSELLVRDAAESIGLSAESLTLSERRRLAEVLK